MGIVGYLDHLQTLLMILIVVVLGGAAILVAFLQIYIRILLTSNIVSV